MAFKAPHNLALVYLPAHHRLLCLHQYGAPRVLLNRPRWLRVVGKSQPLLDPGSVSSQGHGSIQGYRDNSMGSCMEYAQPVWSTLTFWSTLSISKC